jgi:hypothetical protein
VSGAGSGERDDWADRFLVQAAACEELGSPLWSRLLTLLADDVRAGGPTWSVVEPHAGLRYGQAGPLRLVGTAHRLALSGDAPELAALLPSCGGEPPAADAALRAAWDAVVAGHAAELEAGMDREVQTNEVGRAAGLGLAQATTGFASARLVELGCSGGLNLRLERFRIDLDGALLGDPDGAVGLAPRVEGPVPRSLRLPTTTGRIGIDPHPIDATTEAGRLTLLSFVWPDQTERFARLAAALDVARAVPADLRATDDTAGELATVLGDDVPTVVQHSIVWQYIPTAVRWSITAAIEAAGARATAAAPLAWIRFEPDEWDRSRVAVWLRTWPTGGDRLVAHADYHGRWLRPVS